MLIKISAALAYVAMVVVNYLANSLPLNNRSTGAISDAYPNLFAPAGLTFSIWGFIYILLGAYVAYQFVQSNKQTEELFQKIGPFFIATSLVNISWVFAWHYDYIGFSLVLMIILLLLLIKISDILRGTSNDSRQQRLPEASFGLYFGWITVATIANVTVFLVSIKWDGFGLADYIWTSLILLIGALIGILRLHRDKNIAYGFALICAYAGILFKHLSESDFAGAYPSIITTAIVCLCLLLFFWGRILFRKANFY